MTLHRWAEEECNGTIQRDETTGKPFREYGNYIQANDPRRIHYVADRERGALKRLKAIVDARNKRRTNGTLLPYHQGDPRGCALYLVRSTDIPNGSTIDQYYTRGVAVAA